MPRNRDESIDLLKFFAVFLIINSHADACFPRYSFLATGGAIGDALFLFCSGYTIFLGQLRRFDNYYKRRISRIYPSSFAAIVTMLLIQGSFDNLYKIVTLCTARDFLNAIMVYYVFLYVIRVWFIDRMKLVFLFVAVIVGVAYYFFPYKNEVGVKGIFGITTIFRWIPYFGITLMGAYWGSHRNQLKTNFVKDLALLLVCLFCFYGVQFAAKYNAFFAPWQIVCVVFLAGIVFYFYKLCNSDQIKKMYTNKYLNKIILFFSGLCLESYLIQYSVITDKLNFIFPWNLLIVYSLIFVVAYFVRCLSRIFVQVFRSEDFEWKKIFSLI